MSTLNAVNIAQQLVKVGRYSSQEKETADLVINLMEQLGYTTIDRLESGTVVGLFGPKDAPVSLLFDGHIDVAPVAGEWSFDPFCGEIRDGKLLGRGSTDMKAGLACAIFAVAEYAKNHKLETQIAVSASVMEEVMEGLGLEHAILKYKPQNVVICEPTELAVMTGQKGRIEIMITFLGKAAHASNPEVGINSMLIAADALKALDKLVPPVDPLLGTGILVPTDIITEPYPSISQIPPVCKVRFDRRSLPGETEESIFAEIEKCLHDAGITNFKIETVKGDFTTYTENVYNRSISLPPWSLSKDSPLFVAMKTAAQKVLKQEPEVSVWKCCTNGSESAGKYKVPTIGMGPGSIKQAHIVDEYVEIEQIEKVSEIYVQFINEFLK